MARLRLRQQSRGARTNVDVVVTDARLRRRWLRVTPDTYRVRPALPQPAAAAAEAAVLGHPLDAGVIATLTGALADPAVSAALVGAMGKPGLVGGRRAEPEPAPVAMAVRPEALAEAGPLPQGRDRLPALLDRLQASGRRLTLFPVGPTGAPSRRADPIAGPAAVVLSLVPMHDVGGGSRPAQLARALLPHGFHVTFVNAYPSYEDVDLGLRFVHPRLEMAPVDRFDPAALAARTDPAAPRLALLAAPTEPLLAVARRLGAAGFRVMFDVIDDWSHPGLGGDWYRPGLETAAVAAADAVTASAPDLLAKAPGTAVLVPNGVDVAVFARSPGPLPADFPAGEGPVLGYHGSLWPDWFDWASVARVATARPEARILLIGDDRGRRPALPGNVHLLGLKAQDSLPDYVGRFDAGLLPRKVGAATHAMSPLKVYEYLAAGVPVAAPPLRPLANVEGVHVAVDLADAVTAALAAPRPDPAPVCREHSWQARLAALLDAAGLALPPGDDSPASLLIRPPVHHDRRRRSL